MFSRKKVQSLSVINLKCGEQIGRVQDLVVDPQNITVTALILTPKGWFQGIRAISYQEVKGIGTHAVTVTNSRWLPPGKSFPAAKNSSFLLGARVLTTAGDTLGTITDYEFNPSDGKITTFILKQKKGGWGTFFMLSAHFVVTVGKELVVVSEEAKKNLLPLSKQRFLPEGIWKKRKASSLPPDDTN